MELRKRITCWILYGVAALIVSAGAAAALSSAGEEADLAPARLVVDISERKLYAYHGDELQRTYPVAVGTKKYPTPKGSFSLTRIVWNPGWVPPDREWARKERPRKPGDPKNPMVGAKIYFKYPTFYIHGTNAPGTLGTAASHGCIRMNATDVRNLAEFVQEHGGAGRDRSWYDRVRKNRTSSTTVSLPRPVPLTIRA